MIILFIITALVCSYYFVSLKGHVDIVTIAFFSNLLFFIPGFLGYTFIQVGDLKVYASDIAQKTYVVMILSMLSLIITSIYRLGHTGIDFSYSICLPLYESTIG